MWQKVMKEWLLGEDQKLFSERRVRWACKD